MLNIYTNILTGYLLSINVLINQVTILSRMVSKRKANTMLIIMHFCNISRNVQLVFLQQEYKRRSTLRDSYTETEVILLRAASAASVASGATDRSGNTDNCVEEYVCEVPFAGKSLISCV